MATSSDLERPSPRSASADGARAAIWIWLVATVVILLVLGAAWSLRHRVAIPRPEMEPAMPTLPGRTPEPQRP